MKSLLYLALLASAAVATPIAKLGPEARAPQFQPFKADEEDLASYKKREPQFQPFKVDEEDATYKKRQFQVRPCRYSLLIDQIHITQNED